MRCRFLGLVGSMFLVGFLATGCSEPAGAEGGAQTGVSTAGVTPQSDALAASDLSCDGTFELALEFQGITHLVSPRIASPGNVWVHFPRIDPSVSTAKLGVALPAHQARLYLPTANVVIEGRAPLTDFACPPDLTPCQAISLEGLDLRIEGAAEGPLTAAWNQDDPDRSLFLLVDFTRLDKETADEAGKEPLPQEQTLAALQRVPFPGDELASRFHATTGQVQTRKHWDGEFRTAFAVGAAFGGTSAKIARSFEVVTDIDGCATLRLTDLRTGAAAGSVRFGAGGPVRAIAENAPHGHGANAAPAADTSCNDRQHLKAHYLLRNRPEGLKQDQLVVMRDIPADGKPENCDANCSPGCSEPKP